MKNGVFQKIMYSLGSTVATLAVVITAFNANVACVFLAHQPKLPNSAKKLRKF